MKSSFESNLENGALAAFGHGFDDGLVFFSTALAASQDALTAELHLSLRDRQSTDGKCVLMKISFTRVEVMHVDAKWSGIHGDAYILYDGARVLQGDDGALIVDLDPGENDWVPDGWNQKASSFLLAGQGSVEVVR